MDEDLYEAFEVCLQALETGVTIEAALQLFPQLAGELRPALEASVRARALALAVVPEAAIRRARTRVLRHAAGMGITA